MRVAMILTLLSVLVLGTGAAAEAPEQITAIISAVKEVKTAKWQAWRSATVSHYGRPGHDTFMGRKTASGERLVYPSPDFPTIAHKNLAFNTLVQFRNPNNGKVVVTRVNDRGPYIKGRTFDLSYPAAKQLGIVDQGVAKLEYVIIGKIG